MSAEEAAVKWMEEVQAARYGPWREEVEAAKRGNPRPLIASLRSDKAINAEIREFIAQALEPKPKRGRGRPKGKIAVPLPHGDQWMLIGKNDKTYPAARNMWEKQRAGMSFDE